MVVVLVVLVVDCISIVLRMYALSILLLLILLLFKYCKKENSIVNDSGVVTDADMIMLREMAVGNVETSSMLH